MSEPPLFRWIFSAQAERRAAARRYWIKDVVDGAHKWAGYYAMRALPTDWVSRFGAFTGRFSPAAFPRDDARARFAFRTLRPEVDLDDAVGRLWRNVGRTVTEIAILDRIWEEGRITVEGVEHVAALRAAGTPILAAALHLGNWELISIAGVKMGYSGASLALVLPNRFEQRLVTKIRASFGGRMILATPTSGRAMVRELKERGPMVVYLDDFARGKVHAPAFGRPQKMEGNMNYVVRLAKLSGASIVPVYCTRQGETARFVVRIMPPMRIVDTGDADADLDANIAALNGLVEPIVREHLDQWFYVLDLNLERDLAESRASPPLD